MHIRTLKFLTDALDAANDVEAFLKGITKEQFLNDRILQAAIERKFLIIGEALNQSRKYTPDVAPKISELIKLIAFRNVLAHGYDIINEELVWQAAQNHLDPLRQEIEDILDSDDAKRIIAGDGKRSR